MIHCQLIESVELSATLWLTLWDLDGSSQISLELKDPTYSYRVGQVFILDRNAKREGTALRPLTDQDKLSRLELLVPLVTHSPTANQTQTGRSPSSANGKVFGKVVVEPLGQLSTRIATG